MNKQVKSRQRVADHGEVFTAEREVKAMCDLVLPETQRIDSRFLEPACGDGNFLAEVLSRKLAVVRKKYRRSTIDYEMNSLLAVSSLYGVDILADNVAACRERLYKLWAKSHVNPIIAGTSGAEQKVWHNKSYSEEVPISSAYSAIDNDLARDNIENDIPAADLQDI